MKKIVFTILFIIISLAAWGQTLDEYVIEQCRITGVPLGVALAILNEENPDLRFNAINTKNQNGTRDLGLWQLNEYWLEHDFISRYWDRPDKFRWDNPYHSTYIAIRHIRWLYARGFNHWQVILAYNCGAGAIDSNNVPSSSIDYANRAFSRLVRMEVNNAIK
jgi:hypothetical protein